MLKSNYLYKNLSKPVFSKSSEIFTYANFILAFPFFLSIFLFINVFNGNPDFLSKIILINFVEVLLGSAGHNGLSWGLLFFTNEGSTWRERKSSSGLNQKLLFTSLLIFVTSSVIFIFFDNKNSYVFKTYLIIDWFLIHHHNISQTRGISQLFSYKSHSIVSDSQKSNLIRTNHMQKIAFNLLLALSVLPGLKYIFDVPILTNTTEISIFVIISTLLVVWIISLNLKDKVRSIYLARLFYFPIMSFMFSAALIARVIHSFEYIYIYKKVAIDRPSAHSNRSKLLVAISVFAIAVVFWCFSINEQEGLGIFLAKNSDTPVWLKILASLSAVRLYMHYYLDRMLFKMRDIDSRETFGLALNSLAKDF